MIVTVLLVIFVFNVAADSSEQWGPAAFSEVTVCNDTAGGGNNGFGDVSHPALSVGVEGIGGEFVT